MSWTPLLLHPVDAEPLPGVLRLVEHVVRFVEVPDAARVRSDNRRTEPEPHLALGFPDRVDVAASRDLCAHQLLGEALLKNWVEKLSSK